MAHMIDSMAYFGEVPWHGLGTALDRAMTAAEALAFGGLNFEVEKRPMYLADGTPVPSSWAVVRTDRPHDNILGTVGDRYTPLQNVDSFRFFDAFAARGEAMYHTVGSLSGGSRIWILSKLPGEIVVKGQDITEKYLLLSNSHDGTSGVQIKFTPIRVVCHNTLTAALRDTKNTTYNIRHTQSVARAVEEASKVMGISNAYYNELQAAIDVMAAKTVTGAQTRSYLEQCFELSADPADVSTRSKNILANVERLIEVGAGADIPGVRGTAWGLYNAVTEYVDHKSYRTDDTRLENVWFGGAGGALKQRAFDLALAI